MEPLSSLASVVTLVELVGKSSKLLNKAIRLKHAPDVLLALNNEISDLHLVLDDVNDLLLASTSFVPPESLDSALERVKTTLLQLEQFVAYELTTYDSDGSARVDKSTLFRKEQRLHQLKDDVRANRIILGSALNILALSISVHNGHHLRETYCSIERLHNRLDNLRIARDSRPAASDSDSQQIVLRKDDNEHGSNPPTSIQVFRAACDAGCLCTCHRYNRIRSPAFLSKILGTLFIGYRANVSLRQTCNDAACRVRAGGTVCTYTFPAWFLKYAISVSQSRCVVSSRPFGFYTC